MWGLFHKPAYGFLINNHDAMESFDGSFPKPTALNLLDIFLQLHQWDGEECCESLEFEGFLFVKGLLLTPKKTNVVEAGFFLEMFF